MQGAKHHHLDFFLHWILKNLKKCLIFIFITTSALLVCSIYLIYNAPNDYLQGIYAKIMYIHVPAAWLALLIYVMLSGFSILYLAFKNPIYFYSSISLAGIGLTFTIITLITGSIWGKPTWGTWWVWDARLTSMLVLSFIYLAYIFITKSISDELKMANTSSIFAIVGLINIPVIKFSVNLWNTLHQESSVFRASGPSIHSTMLTPLISIFLCFLLFTCGVFVLKLHSKISERKISKLQYLLRK